MEHLNTVNKIITFLKKREEKKQRNSHWALLVVWAAHKVSDWAFPLRSLGDLKLVRNDSSSSLIIQQRTNTPLSLSLSGAPGGGTGDWIKNMDNGTGINSRSVLAAADFINPIPGCVTALLTAR